MKVQAIIPAAGSGNRLKSDTPKPFIELNGKPLIIHTLKAFEECELIDGIILVVPKDSMSDFEGLTQKHSLTKVSRIVGGGESRRESVYNGLQVVDHDTEIVIVHDGARPLVERSLIEKTIHLCEKVDAVAVGVPVKPTIKRINPDEMVVQETIARNHLWEIQTPQVFKKDTLMKAYEAQSNGEATDDAMLVENLGVNVNIIEGSYRNIKVTTLEDLTVVQAFISEG